MHAHQIHLKLKVHFDQVYVVDEDLAEESVRFGLARLIDAGFPPKKIPAVLQQAADALERIFQRRSPNLEAWLKKTSIPNKALSFPLDFIIEIPVSAVGEFDANVVDGAVKFALAQLLDTGWPPGEIPAILRQVAIATEETWLQLCPDAAPPTEWDPDEEEQELYESYVEKLCEFYGKRSIIRAEAGTNDPKNVTRYLVSKVMQRFRIEPSILDQRRDDYPDTNNDRETNDDRQERLERESERLNKNIRTTSEFKKAYGQAVKAERTYFKGQFLLALEHNLTLISRLQAVSHICSMEEESGSVKMARIAPASPDGHEVGGSYFGGKWGVDYFSLWHDLRVYYAFKQSLEFLTFTPSYRTSIVYLEQSFVNFHSEFKISEQDANCIHMFFVRARRWRVVFERAVEVIRDDPGILQKVVRRQLVEQPGPFGFMLGHAANAGAIIRKKTHQGWQLHMPDQTPDPWPALKKQIGL